MSEARALLELIDEFFEIYLRVKSTVEFWLRFKSLISYRNYSNPKYAIKLITDFYITNEFDCLKIRPSTELNFTDQEYLKIELYRAIVILINLVNRLIRITKAIIRINILENFRRDINNLISRIKLKYPTSIVYFDSILNIIR